MHDYPVHYSIAPSGSFSRLQLAVRFVAFLALGVIGLSFGMVFLFAYVALPAYAASRLSADPSRYAPEDGPRVLRAIRWIAVVGAWAALLVEHLPSRAPEEMVEVTVEPRPTPTPAGALWRVVTGLPSALVFMVLCWIGFFVWLWAALTVLLAQHVGPHARNYLVGLQRWAVRLLVYQAGLVDEYPPFSFSDAPPALPTAHVASR